MRKAALCLLAMLQCCWIVSCSAVTPSLEASDLVFLFFCKAEITAGETKTICTVERTAPGIIRFSVLQPEDLAGMGYYWSGDSFSTTYAGLEAQSDTCPLPQANFAVILQETLDYASRSDVLTAGENNTFMGEFDGCAFTLTADPETGRLVNLTVPQKNFTAVFSEYNDTVP